MNVRVKRTVAVIVFLCLLGALLVQAGELCTFTGDRFEKKCWDLFYRLKNEPLNAVIVGASSVYTFYKHPQAYDEQGLYTLTIATPAQPGEVIPYLVDEIEKYGNTELIVVELRTVLKEDCRTEEYSVEERYFRRAEALFALKPFSPNRIKGIFDLLPGDESVPFIEYLLPVLQYHDKTYQLTLSQLLNIGQVDFENYFGYEDNIQSKDLAEEARKLRNAPPSGELHFSDRSKMLIDEIARKVEEHGNQLLFLLTPYMYTSDEYAVACEMQEYMTEKNYSFLNCNDYTEEIGMDHATDYYDLYHTNVVGAHKFTSWFSKYLKEHYGFEGKASEKMEGKWRDLADNWKNTYSQYVGQMKQRQTS